jgi:hypothetical protein
VAKKKKAHYLGVPFSAPELAQIRLRAKAAGQSCATYLRRVIMGIEQGPFTAK